MSSTETTVTPIAGIPPYFKGTAILRVKTAVFKPSRGGNPMIEIKQEIVKPAYIKSDFDDKAYALDSAELSSWLLLWDLDKSGKPLQTGLAWLNEVFLPKLGIEQKFNPENPLWSETNPTGVKLAGLCWEAIVGTEERIEKKRLPNGDWVPIKDMQGNEIKRGWQWQNVQADAILRAAEVETNRPY